MKQDNLKAKKVRVQIDPRYMKKVDETMIKYGYESLKDFTNDAIKHYINFLSDEPKEITIKANNSRSLLNEMCKLDNEIHNFQKRPSNENRYKIEQRLVKLYGICTN